MNNQDKKEELLKYQEAVREAERLEREILRWYARAEKMTAVVRLTPAGGPGGRSLEDAVGQIEALAARLGETHRETVELRRRIEDAVVRVEDGRLRELLRRRYIDGDTWEGIAVKMGMSYQWVCHLHGAALEEIQLS